jgi:hypothetical protein
VHRESQEQMRAERREPYDHEVPFAVRCGELMSVVQADDPDTVTDSPFVGRRVPSPMRRAEVQKERNFGRGEVTLLNRYAKAARAREVAVHVRAKAGGGAPLHGLPSAQFRAVFGCFHCPF